MLPAWATVVIAVGGSALGALAGVTGSYLTLRVAKLNIAHEAQEAWTNRMVAGAEAFETAYAAVYWLVARKIVEPRTSSAAIIDEARAGLIGLAPKLVTVGLMFGVDSPAVSAAADALDKLRSAIDEAAKGNDAALDRAEALCDAADDYSDVFLREAWKAMRS